MMEFHDLLGPEYMYSAFYPLIKNCIQPIRVKDMEIGALRPKPPSRSQKGEFLLPPCKSILNHSPY